MTLNLQICEEEEVGLSVSGDEPVDIIGNYLLPASLNNLDPEDYDYDNLYDDEDDEDEDDDDDVCLFEKSRILTSRSLRTYVISSDQEQDTYHEMPHLALLTYCTDHACHLRGVRKVVGLRQCPASL